MPEVAFVFVEALPVVRGDQDSGSRCDRFERAGQPADATVEERDLAGVPGGQMAYVGRVGTLGFSKGSI